MLFRSFSFSRRAPRTNARNTSSTLETPVSTTAEQQPSNAHNVDAQNRRAPETRRRSTRLSSESQKPNSIPHAKQTAPRQREHATDHDRGRAHSPLKIALPFADTPIIDRNKRMRKISGQNRRRSSSTFRGRRASSMLDSGSSNGLCRLHRWSRHR